MVGKLGGCCCGGGGGGGEPINCAPYHPQIPAGLTESDGPYQWPPGTSSRSLQINNVLKKSVRFSGTWSPVYALSSIQLFIQHFNPPPVSLQWVPQILLRAYNTPLGTFPAQRRLLVTIFRTTDPGLTTTYDSGWRAGFDLSGYTELTVTYAGNVLTAGYSSIGLSGSISATVDPAMQNPNFCWIPGTYSIPSGTQSMAYTGLTLATYQ